MLFAGFTMTLKKILFVLFLIISLLIADQNVPVKGQILDTSTQKPVSDVSIYFSDREQGTVSDSLGSFSLSVQTKNMNKPLIFDHIAYRSLKMTPDKLISLNGERIYLQPALLAYGENIQVTASRSPLSIKYSPSAVEVISVDDSRTTAKLSLSHMIDMSPSVGIKDYGGVSAMKSISLRGATAGQVLIMLNGQRLNSPQNGEVDLSLIPAASIERIEIVRGGQSALYGADAVGGVVNIITQDNHIIQDHVLHTSFESSFGSLATYSAGGHLNFSHRHFSFTLSGSYLSSQGNYSYLDNWGDRHIRENNDSRSLQFYSSVKYAKAKSIYRMTYLFNTAERGVPGTLAPVYLSARQWDQRQSFQFHTVVEKGVHSLSADIDYDRTWNRYVNDEMLVPLDNKYLTQSPSFGFQDRMDFGNAARITWGLGANYNMQETLHYDTTFSRLSTHGFIMDESKIVFHNKASSSLILQPALRADLHSDYEMAVSPQLGMLLFPAAGEKLSIRTTMGQSFRAPTFNDLYWPRDSYAVGNPDLEPERGLDWEAGMRYQPSAETYCELNYFYRHVRDMIIWLDHAGFWWPENLDAAEITGLESVYHQTLGHNLKMDMNYTFLNSVNLSHSESEYGRQLPYRPRHTMNMSINYVLKKCEFSYRVKLVSKQYVDSHNTELHALDPYSLSSLSASFPFVIRNFTLHLETGVDNLFNTDYRTLKDIPMPGRIWNISVKIDFNSKQKEFQQ